MTMEQFYLSIKNTQRKIEDVRNLFKNLTTREKEILELEKLRAERLKLERDSNINMNMNVTNMSINLNNGSITRPNNNIYQRFQQQESFKTPDSVRKCHKRIDKRSLESVNSCSRGESSCSSKSSKSSSSKISSTASNSSSSSSGNENGNIESINFQMIQKSEIINFNKLNQNQHRQINYLLASGHREKHDGSSGGKVRRKIHYNSKNNENSIENIAPFNNNSNCQQYFYNYHHIATTTTAVNQSPSSPQPQSNTRHNVQFINAIYKNEQRKSIQNSAVAASKLASLFGGASSGSGTTEGVTITSNTPCTTPSTTPQNLSIHQQHQHHHKRYNTPLLLASNKENGAVASPEMKKSKRSSPLTQKYPMRLQNSNGGAAAYRGTRASGYEANLELRDEVLLSRYRSKREQQRADLKLIENSRYLIRKKHSSNLNSAPNAFHEFSFYPK